MTTVSVGDVIVGEGQSFVDFVVRLDAPSASTVTVSYQTANQSAIAGSDYIAISGSLSFAAGETVKTVRVSISDDASVETLENFELQLYSPSNGVLGRSVGSAVIVDNDGTSGTPVVSIGDTVVDESAGQATFVVRLDRPGTSLITMNYATQSNSAGGQDYDAVSGALAFAPGETVKTITVNVTNDALAEGAESFSLVLSSVVGATAPDLVAVGTIASSDQVAVSQPRISVGNVIVGEGEGYVDFLVSLDAPSASAVSVNYQTNNQTAASGSDFDFASGFLTFAPGEVLKTVRVGIVNDAGAETLESFELQLYSPTGGVLGQSVGSATIVDNDGASGTPVVNIDDIIVDEGAGLATFMVRLDRPSTSVVTMNYATQDGTALAGSDYFQATGVLSFAPGETARMVTVNILNNTLVEGAKTLQLVLSSVFNANAPDTSAVATIAPSDQVAVALPRLSASDVVVGEGQGYVDFVVRLDAPSASAVSVNYQTSNQSAASGSDYGFTSGFLTFAPGETVKTVRVSLVNDLLVENLETFELQLYSPTNAVIGQKTATATIMDNDGPSGTPVVTIGDMIIDEASGQAGFVIRLDRPSTSVVMMNYATQDGTAQSASDYQAVSGVLSFAPGETAKMVMVNVTNDAALEGAESFNLVMSSVVNAVATDAVGTAIIAASDQPSVALPRLSVGDVMVGESQGYVDFVVRLDAPGAIAVTVNYQLDTQSGSYPSDFGNTSGFLTFAPGETVKTVRIVIADDGVAENIEGFEFQIHSPTNAVLGQSIATATIIDNDLTSGTPVVSIGDMVVDEASGQAAFMIHLDRPSTSIVSMNYATRNGTAAAGSDFEATSGVLAFAPGETAKMVMVNITNDAAVEGAETFGLVLSSIANAIAPNTVGTAIIAASDQASAASPRISVDNVMAGEGEGYVDFLVRLDAPSAGAVSVNYQMNNQSASGGSDYGNTSGVLTFAPGETLKTVRIVIVNDTTSENVESFELKLFSPTNGVLGQSVGVATVIDNDGTSGTPVVSVDDMTVDEASGQAVFMVRLDRPSTSIVTMNVATQSGSAVAGADFEAVSGVLSFAPGETARMVRVNITNDAANEGAESFSLVLSSLANGTVHKAYGTATIAANDATAVATPTISAADVLAGESRGYVDFVVTLSAPSASAVSVNYQTANQTAFSGSDYGFTSGILTFASGETAKSVRVVLVNDGSTESPETFQLELFSPTGGVVGTTPTATIYDDVKSGSSGNDTIIGTIYDDVISGGDGNDTLTGLAGNDLIDGGAGTDAAVFGATRAATAFILYNGAILAHGAATGLDTITNVEALQFSDQTVSTSAIAQFRPLDYVASYGDLIAGIGTNTQTAVDHYLSYGHFEGRSADNFDGLLYLDSNPDLLIAFGTNEDLAAQHYITDGYAEGRQKASFDPLRYIASNPDLLQAFGTNTHAAELHYIVNGYAEGRSTTSFDPLRYVASNTDLIPTLGVNAVLAEQQYITTGFSQGRSTTSFDTISYIASNTDLLQAFGMNTTAAETHYIQYGFSEHRAVTSFNALEYTASNIDLLQAFGTNTAAAETHYIQNGFAEGRPTTSFNVVQYLANYSDLSSAFGTNYDAARAHYINNGYAEGRTDQPLPGHEPGNPGASFTSLFADAAIISTYDAPFPDPMPSTIPHAGDWSVV